MAANTSIEWTDRTWNPVRGCSVISPGCVNCYAMKQAHRFSGTGKPYEGLTKLTKAGPQWTAKIRTVDDALTEPLSWRAPQRIFVNSMSDLFHEGVPTVFIADVFAVMRCASRHTFQILTKRADRMRQVLQDQSFRSRVDELTEPQQPWPLPNVWLGVSAEDQKHADERIPHLLETPAAVRFVSAEPLLGPIDFDAFLDCGHESNGPAGWIPSASLDLVIFGGESHQSREKARPCAIEWIERGVQQCQAAGVAAFVKQLGTRPFGTDVLVGQLRRENPEIDAEFPLIEAAITKAECHERIRQAGIELPAMYRLGYSNNNCIGCVKGGAGYWNKIRVDFPERFTEMAKIEREIGAAICKTEPTIAGVRQRIPVYLDELPLDMGRLEDEHIECGVLCLSNDAAYLREPPQEQEQSTPPIIGKPPHARTGRTTQRSHGGRAQRTGARLEDAVANGQRAVLLSIGGPL